MAEAGNPLSPLTVSSVTAAFAAAGVQLPPPTVLAQTESTNSDAVALANKGMPAGTIVVADYQSAGRGRLDRTWSAQPGEALMFSMILRPFAMWLPEALGWMPLLAGVAVCQAIQAAGVPAAQLKWPNDVLIGDQKVAGILAERSGNAVIIGVGINVAMTADRLPVPTATSLNLQGAQADRPTLLASAAVGITSWMDRMTAARGIASDCGLRDRYLTECATIGREVRVEMAGRDDVRGEAAGIDADGRLLVRESASGNLTEVSAGDVIHVR